MKTIHPFPARMAPDIALDRLGQLKKGSRILDPMAGSGTVLRQAINLGHKASGFDLDPLAVLMASVWTTPVDDGLVGEEAARLVKEARALDLSEISLPWIDNDEETVAFIKYWFGLRQRRDLRRIAFILNKFGARKKLPSSVLNVLKLALSRIIITKEQNASLARDTSHSRPHKVCDRSDFDVFNAFERSILFLRKRLIDYPPMIGASVALGDARHLSAVKNASIDAVLTSPPYLNAIDYLRGHRLALVWLGRGFGELRAIRSVSIGAERGPNDPASARMFERIKSAMGQFDQLPKRYGSMIDRYSEDVYRMMSEISRVLRPRGIATFVVGNSCLKGTFVHNSAGVAEAALMLGLRHIETTERELPDNKRYLPITGGGSLGKRMRSETICSFAKR